MQTRELLADCSLDMVGRRLDDLTAATAALPSGTRVNVGAATGQSAQVHRMTGVAIADAGLTPVPHLAARRFGSEQELREVLTGLQNDGTGHQLFIIGGDPPTPEGPFDSALALIRSVRLADYGVETVGIGGYPEGHPAIPADVLHTALRAKVDELARQRMRLELFTQLALTVDPVLTWIESIRREGIHAPIRVGACGPIEPARLLGYARRVGAASDPDSVERYGFSLADPPSRVGPGRFIAELAERLDPVVHGEVRMHFFSLGGLRETAQWIHEALR
nr:methylenetetrahydrofolate reductase [Microbacterium bovistercoris]